MKMTIARETEWMNRQPQGRQAKSKARQSNFQDLVEKSKSFQTGRTALNLITDESGTTSRRYNFTSIVIIIYKIGK